MFVRHLRLHFFICFAKKRSPVPLHETAVDFWTVRFDPEKATRQSGATRLVATVKIFIVQRVRVEGWEVLGDGEDDEDVEGLDG